MRKSNFPLQYGIFLASAFAVVQLIGCSAKVEVKSQPSPGASAVVASSPTIPTKDESDNKFSVEDRLSAILRTDSDLIQVCYDPEDVNDEKGVLTHMLGYLIKHRSATVEGQDLGEGWRYIDKVSFSVTAAGKVYAARPNYLEYEPQYPDVAGLQCKQQ